MRSLALKRNSAKVPVEDQSANVFGFAGRRISVLTQLGHRRGKAATDNMQMNAGGRMLRKLYL